MIKIYRYVSEKTGDVLEVHFCKSHISYRVNNDKFARISNYDLNLVLKCGEYIFKDFGE